MPKVIVIDPGHDREEVGSVQADGQLEYQFTLPLALAVADELNRRYECDVVLTHQTPAGVVPGPDPAAELYARAQLANQVGADLLVSLHHNAGPAAATGAELYIHTRLRSYGGRVTRTYPAGEGSLVWLDAAYWQPDGSPNHDAPRSMALAQIMQPIIRDTLAGLGIPWRGAPGRIMAADFAVLRYPNLPCMLLETHYGTSPEDDAAADRPSFIPTLAVGIARAIGTGLELPPKLWVHPAVLVRWEPTGREYWGRMVDGRAVVTLPGTDREQEIRLLAEGLGYQVDWTPNPPTATIRPRGPVA